MNETPAGRELKRVWNKWTRFPVPPASEQSCLALTEPIYNLVGSLLTSPSQSAAPTLDQSRRVGALLGEALGQLTRACYMLGLEHASARVANPLTAASLASQAEYAASLINEASNPAKQLLSTIVADAIGSGIMPKAEAETIADEIGDSIAKTATGCYEAGMTDAPVAETPTASEPLPEKSVLRELWSSFTVPSEIEEDLVLRAGKIESAIWSYIDSFPFSISGTQSFLEAMGLATQLRLETNLKVNDALRDSVYLGLQLASSTKHHAPRLSPLVMARLVAICYPTLLLIASVPGHFSNLAPGSASSLPLPIPELAQLVLAGAALAIFAGHTAGTAHAP